VRGRGDGSVLRMITDSRLKKEKNRMISDSASTGKRVQGRFLFFLLF
jgi:hypothetical protein